MWCANLLQSISVKKNVENRSVFDAVKIKIKGLLFTGPVYTAQYLIDCKGRRNSESRPGPYTNP